MNLIFKNQKINDLNKEEFIQLKSSKGDKVFQIRKFTFGVLAHNEKNPLCCTSQANSTISIDLWKGCQWQCAYCHVQGSSQDWDKGSQSMGNTPTQRSKFGVDEILDSLMEHPFFEPNVTVISIGTASTEPFSNYVVESTFAIMDYFKNRNLRNPFWIVTKSSFPEKYKKRLAAIVRNGNTVLVSICWANNPAEIEPARNNRFINIEKIKEAGAYTSWYLRPLADSWSTSEENLSRSFDHASKYSNYIDMVIPGGLRWTEGIEYAMEEVKGVSLPPIIKDDNTKFLSTKTIKLIRKFHLKYMGGEKPLFFKSSCSLSYVLNLSNLNLAQIRNKHECESSICPIVQREVCNKFRLPSVRKLNSRLKKIGLSEIIVESIDKNGNIKANPSLGEFPFAIRQKIYHELAR